MTAAAFRRLDRKCNISMLTFHPQMFVRIQELSGPRAPQPSPLQSGFLADWLYHVLDIYNASEFSDALFILAIDRDEI